MWSLASQQSCKQVVIQPHATVSLFYPTPTTAPMSSSSERRRFWPVIRYATDAETSEKVALREKVLNRVHRMELVIVSAFISLTRVRLCVFR